MTSLKSQLQALIINRGTVSYGELVELALREGYKTSAMDARLREICQASHIEPTFATSKRGSRYINGYRYVPVPLPPAFAPKRTVIQPDEVARFAQEGDPNRTVI